MLGNIAVTTVETHSPDFSINRVMYTYIYIEHLRLLSGEALALKFYLSIGGNSRRICYSNISLLLALSDGENPF